MPELRKPRTLLEQLFMPVPQVKEPPPRVVENPPKSPMAKLNEPMTGPAFLAAEKARSTLHKIGPELPIRERGKLDPATLGDVVSSLFVPRTKGEGILAAIPPARIKAAGKLFRVFPTGSIDDEIANLAQRTAPAIKAARKGTSGVERALGAAKAEGAYSPAQRVTGNVLAESKVYYGAIRNRKTGEVWTDPGIAAFDRHGVIPESQIYLSKRLGAETREDLERLEESGELEKAIKELFDFDEAHGGGAATPPGWNEIMNDFDEYGRMVPSKTGETVFVPHSTTYAPLSTEAKEAERRTSETYRTLKDELENLERRKQNLTELPPTRGPRIVDLTDSEGGIKRLDLPTEGPSEVSEETMDRLDELFMPKKKKKPTVH
jgi:hypothetical protein